MEKIICVSEKKFTIFENGKQKEIESAAITRYREALRSIQQRNEWKSSGAGARFTGTEAEHVNFDNNNINAHISGLTRYDEKSALYAVNSDGVGGLYIITPDSPDEPERLILSRNNTTIDTLSIKDGKCAASIGGIGDEAHLTIITLPDGRYEELTDGDTREEYPSFSCARNGIYFSAVGFARNQTGALVAFSPRGIGFYDLGKREIEDVLESDKSDFLRPRDDENGNLYYIKRPYGTKSSNTDILIDILMFPIRIIKGIGGFLNAFTTLFGGESLRTNSANRAEKAKQKSEKELFIDGNKINAEKAIKENAQRGEKYPGIIPHSWELIKKTPDGTETVIYRGVLDYALCKDSSVIVSNGRALLRCTADGNQELIGKCRLATDIALL